VNAISPGVIRTPNLDPAVQHPAEVMMRGTPAGRVGTPDAIAHAAVYLAGGQVGAAVIAV
jgi:NAD(P)-dependent dehydrogenase (short-subunit alcohol dehydrogenase family)